MVNRSCWGPSDLSVEKNVFFFFFKCMLGKSPAFTSETLALSPKTLNCSVEGSQCDVDSMKVCLPVFAAHFFPLCQHWAGQSWFPTVSHLQRQQRQQQVAEPLPSFISLFTRHSGPFPLSVWRRLESRISAFSHSTAHFSLSHSCSISQHPIILTKKK